MDAVYTWVDGGDPEYRRVRDAWAERLGMVCNPERDRDDLQLLRYSLRSLEKYAPWIERIFIATQRPQVPAWLRPDERIRIVHHDEIFRNPEDLPTFNSNAIDFNLGNIPGLGPQFLYFNDDYLLGSKLRPEHVISKQGTPRVYLSRTPIPEVGQDAWARILAATGRLLNEQFGVARRGKHEHTPCLLVRELLRCEGEAIRQTIARRFRGDHDIAFETYQSHMLLESGLGQRVPPLEYRLRTSFQRLEHDLDSLPGLLRTLRWKRPRFFCLNDDMGPEPSPLYVERVRDFLESLYPRPASFEKIS